MKSYKAKSAIFGLFRAFLTPFWGSGDATRVFPKKLWTISNPYWYITSCKKSEKSNGRFSRKSRTNGRTNGRTDGQAWFLRSPPMNRVTKNLSWPNQKSMSETEVRWPSIPFDKINKMCLNPLCWYVWIWISYVILTVSQICIHPFSTKENTPSSLKA